MTVHALAARWCTDRDNHNWVRWQKFAHSEITRTLLFYLSRYKEFDSPELMTRAVNLIHRQVVKAKAEGLYFNVRPDLMPNVRLCVRQQVSTLQLFKAILDDQRSLPKDRPYKDLIQLITFILRKFFKAVQEEPFLVIEVRHSSWLIYCPLSAMLIGFSGSCNLGVVSYEPRSLEAILELGTRTKSQSQTGDGRRQRWFLRGGPS